MTTMLTPSMFDNNPPSVPMNDYAPAGVDTISMDDQFAEIAARFDPIDDSFALTGGTSLDVGTGMPISVNNHDDYGAIMHLNLDPSHTGGTENSGAITPNIVDPTASLAGASPMMGIDVRATINYALGCSYCGQPAH